MAIERMSPECNLATLRDGRGGIFTYYPKDAPIVEWSVLFTRAGESRGFHFHSEFDEYVLIMAGHGTYVERNRDGGEEFFKVSASDCLYFASGTEHTVYAITDMRIVAMLTKTWNSCREPMTRVE
jgi:mannose-6-phosphate isomerase-like protein (cupin superfamily)